MLLVLLSAVRVQRTRDTSTPRDRRDEPSYWVWLGVCRRRAGARRWCSGSPSTAAVSWQRAIAVPAVLGAVVAASLITHWVRPETGPAATGAARPGGRGPP